MPHFFINPQQKLKEHDIYEITDRENYNHIVKSLRSKAGETLLLIDTNRIEYKTVIKEITSKTINVEILSFEESKRDLPYNLYLAQSPLRSDAQLTIMEKATELGVRGVYPVYTDNCALKHSVAKSKTEKWQKVMYEASKQCERATIPTCYELTDLKTVLQDKQFDRTIALCERDTTESLKKYLSSEPIKEGENVLVIIGPEGGFSDKEFALFREMKLPRLSLGDLILKAETAVIVTLGNIVYESAG